ncbi:putative aminotransferase [Segniliparus rotundus DSM 44985]|uniref:Putative aminotransferase n=1 Tax=Segniliparus rotundus (strain ATCC BAA-972 / CDC 1076 / CIP 108378 / DSM 44985 / JCM 13578) TaxID=640132 RepID=D6ZCN5_SEGRD|nr:hypothetical protein [Segniliparus rotundus]ADG97077.1 putative aminotransferase [Segniliparus rotundus DSM 44985]
MAGDPLSTNIERLRLFGQNVSDGSEQAESAGAGGLYGSVSLPGAETAQAAVDAAQAHRAVVGRLRGEYAYAGEETASDAARFQGHEEDHAARFRQTYDEIDQSATGLGAQSAEA